MARKWIRLVMSMARFARWPWVPVHTLRTSQLGPAVDTHQCAARQSCTRMWRSLACRMSSATKADIVSDKTPTTHPFLACCLRPCLLNTAIAGPRSQQRALAKLLQQFAGTCMYTVSHRVLACHEHFTAFIDVQFANLHTSATSVRTPLQVHPLSRLSLHD